MKTLVAFGTRRGTTRRCAQLVGETLRLKGHVVDLVDLGAGGKLPSTHGYDLVVVGAGARMGKLHEKARQFLGRRQEEIPSGKLALFACCGEQSEEGIRNLFWASYPPGLMVRARSAVGLGGCLNVSQEPWLWKALLSQTRTKDFDTVDESQVCRWAASLA